MGTSRKQLTIIGRGWANWSARHWQITIFCDEFHNCFIIRSPSLFFNEYLREAKSSTISTQERSQEGEKRCRILFVAKHSWTTLRMTSRPLLGSSLREAVIFKSRGGLSANEKKEKFASNDNLFCEQNNGSHFIWYITSTSTTRQWRETSVMGRGPGHKTFSFELGYSAWEPNSRQIHLLYSWKTEWR